MWASSTGGGCRLPNYKTFTRTSKYGLTLVKWHRFTQYSWSLTVEKQIVSTLYWIMICYKNMVGTEISKICLLCLSTKTTHSHIIYSNCYYLLSCLGLSLILSVIHLLLFENLEFFDNFCIINFRKTFFFLNMEIYNYEEVKSTLIITYTFTQVILT